MSQASVQSQPKTESAWKPLKRPVFRAVWIASVASQIGTWVHDVGAAWMMTTLSPSPLMVSLVQAAGTLPLFLFAIPAGALADLVDRRKLLLFTQSWMLLVAILLTAVTWLGYTGPVVLLVFTAVLGVGAAINAPAWQATTPELVPPEELSLAVSLNGMAINLSRSVGPAIGGLMVGLSGPQSAFALNAVSFLGVVFVLARWKREPTASALPPERFGHALVAGIRYARYADGFRNALVRSFLFLFPASALWALLPHVASRELGLSALGYGGLMSAVGLGAMISANVLPKLREKFPQQPLTFVAALVVATCIGLLSQSIQIVVVWPVLLVLGTGWLVMLSALNLGAQAAAAGWARARALAVALFVFFGSMSVGSIAWGAVAEAVGVRETLLGAATLTAIAALPALRFPMKDSSSASLAPSLHWPMPEDLLQADEEDRGPVMVVLEYHVSSEHRAEFLELLHQLRRSRLRDGAYDWDLFDDSESSNHIIEVFFADSWVEHLRHHERVNLEDQSVQKKVAALQSSHEYPRVRHMLATRR